MNKFKIGLTLLFLQLISSQSFGQEIYTDFPENISENGKYVFYSHGFIVEGDNPKPINKNPGWGVYDFPEIKMALSDKEYTLIAFHRQKNTDPFDYAKKLEIQVRKLVKSGVQPKNITILGFSRGGFITGLTSNLLSDIEVNTILLATCGRILRNEFKDIHLYGEVLSIYEKSDGAQSCQKFIDRSPKVISFEEIEINTGLSHGAFYQPYPEWITPVKHWIKSRGN